MVGEREQTPRGARALRGVRPAAAWVGERLKRERGRGSGARPGASF
jgi:hypothetical protein